MEKVVTLFETYDQGDKAADALVSAGFNADDISLDNADTLGSVEVIATPAFWNELFGRDVEEYEAATYAKAVKDGGSVVTVRTDDPKKALGVLHSHPAVSVKKKAVEHKVLSEKAAKNLPPVAEDHEDYIRLAAESVDVGKKLYEEGSTRIRRFVTTKPVEAKVSLHDEHVEVVRRAVDNPDVLDNDWGEATIEMRETAEKPYVTKHSRIVGEVGLKKVGVDTEQTVRDEVRSEDVEIEQVPQGEKFVKDEGIVAKDLS